MLALALASSMTPLALTPMMFPTWSLHLARPLTSIALSRIVHINQWGRLSQATVKMVMALQTCTEPPPCQTLRAHKPERMTIVPGWHHVCFAFAWLTALGIGVRHFMLMP